MGVADVVPGVSGGTIALVMGIYDQLITTITRFDARLLNTIRRGQFTQAGRHINLDFLLSLIPGILAGILCMSALASTLLDAPVSRQFTFAAFFGMIAISAYLVIETIKTNSSAAKLQVAVFIVIGFVTALLLNQLQDPNGTPTDFEPDKLYLFICASIAICAMILPGISGSMILMLLGVYDHVVRLPKAIFNEQTQTEAILRLAIFAFGPGIGLILFSRVLKWFLTHFRNPLLALLTGVMIGALPVLTDQAFSLKPLNETSNRPTTVALIGTALVAALAMFFFTRQAAALTNKKK